MTGTEILDKILDNFNQAVANMSLTVMGETEWGERYDSIKAETISAIQDNVHNIARQESPNATE